MLEIRNVTKVYKPKKGQAVTALNDISLKFQDKGMVFILGKSGSGKSTLLNVLGGLDKIDSGEIIIKGKSSKKFTQGDFDSYRNTYVGFIFQEYKILEEFTVGANIALAIQLQGRKATNEEINYIMDEVDLSGYGSRKPNELSGGQMQRVAIARALVKNPEIIMADEPTGALDSKTGIQVFDTLKKLSRTKLVIVVSHDREFAEHYGDRVIELADGKIISDIEKYVAAPDTISDGISIVDDNVLHIKQGYNLSISDVEMINTYLSKAQNDVIISLDSATNDNIKKYARIDDEGNKESFRPTDEEKYDGLSSNTFTLLKSKLPFRNSLKIGASGLKVKPFRLFLTILLSFTAFTLFGLADTMGSYNQINTSLTSIRDSNIKNITYRKEIKIQDEWDDSYYYYEPDKLNEDDFANLKKDLGVNFKPIYNKSTEYYNDFLVSIFDNFQDGSKLGDIYSGYYIASISGFVEFTKDELDKLGFNVKGEMPQNNNEIAITNYIYEHFKKAGYRSNKDVLTPEKVNKEDDIIGKTITISNKSYKITAIIDTNFNEERYESLKEQTENIGFGDYMKIKEFRTAIAYGYHSLVYTKPGFIAEVSKEDSLIKLDNGNIYLEGLDSYLSSLQVVSDDDDIVFFKSNKTALSENEILVSVPYYFDYYLDIYNIPAKTEDVPDGWDSNNYKLGNLLDTIKDYAIEEYAKKNYQTAFENGLGPEDIDSEYEDELTDDDKIEIYRTYLQTYGYSGYYKNEYGEKSGYEIEWDAKKPIIKKYDLFANGFNGLDELEDTMMIEIWNNRNTSETINVKVVGVYYLNDNNISTYDGYSYQIDSYINMIDKNLSKVFSSLLGGNYSWALTSIPENDDELIKMLEYTYDNTENDVNYRITNEVSFLLDEVNGFIEGTSKVFLYVGIGFAVFSSLLLMNFITLSISYKKREIGILRALGARSKDVFGIFFNESMLIAIINFVIALFATVSIVLYINNYLRGEYGLLITFLNFGIRQIVLMLLISIAIAFISSFLPVNKIARKKPIDAIRNR